MKNKNITYIPNELASAVKNGYVTSAEQVKDYHYDKSQEDINTDVHLDIYGVGSGLKDRMSAFEDLVKVSVDGDSYGIVNTPEDIQPGIGKLTTANAVAGINHFVNTNSNWIYVIVDAEGKILGGITKAGEIEWKKGVPTPIREYIEVTANEINNQVNETLSFIDYVSSNKWIYAITDKEGKVLAGINKDGICWANGLQQEIENFSQEWITRDDMIEVTVDSLGQILSYRKPDGTKVETKLQVADMNANIKLAAISDWSDKMEVTLPFPEEGATVNLIVGSGPNSKYGLPGVKGSNWSAEIEYWDRKGNYFRKPITLDAQGNTSLVFEIPNQAVDLEDGSTIKIGDWVSQDSFHLKKYYQDSFRGASVVAYKLLEQVYQSRPEDDQRPWSDQIRQENPYNGSGKIKEDYNTGALGHPDGFPIELFVNGNSVGIYVFALKKHRDNYYMKKSSSKNILLDGILGSEFWQANGNLNNHGPNQFNTVWDGFEIRNPKTLVYSGPHFLTNYPYWSDEIRYNKGDIVVYGCYQFKCLDANENVIPSSDDDYWELIVSGIEYDADIIETDIVGPNGTSKPNYPDWDSNSEYQSPKYEEGYRDSDYVQYTKIVENGQIKYENPNTQIRYELGTYQWLPWFKLNGQEIRQAYPSNILSEGDIVKYGGSYFMCTLPNNEEQPKILYRINNIPSEVLAEKNFDIAMIKSDYSWLDIDVKSKKNRINITSSDEDFDSVEEACDAIMDILGCGELKIYNTDDNPDYENKTECGWINCTTCIKVKQNINRLTTAMKTIDEQPSEEEMKAKFEEYFNLGFLIDYLLIGNVIYHYDGFLKNWIWGTWDGKKWSPTLYDCDSIFGEHHLGYLTVPFSIKNILGTNAWGPTKYLSKTYIVDYYTKENGFYKSGMYFDEVCKRYAELRDLEIFSVDNIMLIIEDWLERVGYDRLKKEYEELFPETPSYRDPLINDEYWELQEDYPTTIANNVVSSYSSSKEYKIGQYVYVTKTQLYKIIGGVETPISRSQLGNGVVNEYQSNYSYQEGDVYYITTTQVYQAREDIQGISPNSDTNQEHWLLVENKTVDQLRNESTLVTIYNPNSTYTKGSYVKYTTDVFCYKAIKNVPKGEAPCKLRSNFPQEGGFFNGVQRVKNWLIEKIDYLDEYYKYNQK